MKTCPQCGTPNPDEHQYCQKCGQALVVDGGRDEGATVALSGSKARALAPSTANRGLAVKVFTSPTGDPHRSIPIDELFAAKARLVLGRGADCDICLPHPQVSRFHALLERLPEGLRLRDLGSVNGTLVEGRRIFEPTSLKEHQRFGIGPYLFCPFGGAIHALDSSQSLRLEARRLEKIVEGTDGGRRKLLDNINLALEPGEFVSLLGPSGSGKSTLMDCLNGRRPATGGQVLANGEDFYQHFDSFRQSLGYVPQRDIVHTQLTVARALYYTARLRLPLDTDPAELNTRIDQVMQLMELGPHRDTLVANLSGGQVKRVSLGAELLAQPSLLYIDEATSGLDAGTEARMMHLFRHLANEGKSIICITHNVDNVDLCNLIIILARGKLVYYGPPAETRPYFGVSRISEIYDSLTRKTPEEWEKQYAGCSLHREFVAQRLASAPEGSLLSQVSAPPPAAERAEVVQTERPRRLFLHQFGVLTARYAELIWKDRRSLRLLLLQAPIVALFLLLGFVNKPYQSTILAPRRLTPGERDALVKIIQLRKENKDLDPTGHLAARIREELGPTGEALAPVGSLVDVSMLEKLVAEQGPVVPDQVIVNPRYTYMLLFIVVISIMWFGCNNAAKEIVKEEAIYARERAVNLGIMPYLASKFTVLTVISAVQTLIMMLVVYGVLALLQATLGWKGPAPVYRLDYLPQYGVLVLLAMTGVALGLLLSACVSSPDRATTLLPYVLIPQIILGGGIMPVNTEPLHTVAAVFSPAYWAFRAVRRGATTLLPADFPGHTEYNDSVWICCVALIVQMLVLLAVTGWFLQQKDVHKE
jgi:ABC-type multidrug transport system ATPase subunit